MENSQIDENKNDYSVLKNHMLKCGDIKWKNTVSYVTYKRTYARRLDDSDPKSETEEFNDTLFRIITAFNEQLNMNLSAQEQCEYYDMFANFKALPAGRFLWQLGTKTVDKYGLLSLQNCAFTEINNYDSFCWAFDCLMLGCVPPNAPVLTDRGIVEIKDIKIGDKVWSWNQKEKRLEYKPVTQLHDVIVEKSENVKITGRYGHVITSKKHPLLVLRNGEWTFVKAGEIIKGDILQRFNVKKNKIEFDKKAWFVGSYLGDGTSRRQKKYDGLHVRLNGNNESVVASFANTLSEIANIETKYTVDESKHYSVPMWKMDKTLYRDNKIAKQWDTLVGHYTAAKTKYIHIPEWIKSTYDKNIFMSFLAGLIDTDGHISDKCKIHYTTSSEQMKKDLEKYCPIYGIYPYIQTTTPDEYKRYCENGSGKNGFMPKSDSFTISLSVNEFKGYESFIQHDIKRNKIKEYLTNQNRNVKKELIIPPDMLEQEMEKLNLGSTKYNFTNRVNNYGYVQASTYTRRGLSTDHLDNYDVVCEIEDNLDITEYFKDITVEGNNSYVTGFGSYYTSHNSGVGFNIQREFVYKLPKPYKVECKRIDGNDADFIVPDSREGWVALLRYLLRAHFEKHSCQNKKFSYSCHCLRSKGALIKGFGGTASGPDHLCEGIADINKIINNRADKNEPLRPIDCLDIMNIIARTVISGNVRRSALICIGDYDDMEYLKAKRWDLGNIPNWRCYSNNSVVCDDTKKLPEEFWEGYKGNGECYGLINLNLARKMGRTGEFQYPDHKVSGFNPSMRKGTRVMTSEGVKAIHTLQDTFFKVKALDGHWVLARCWKSGVDKPLYKVTLANGREYYSTAEHKWPVRGANKTMETISETPMEEKDVSDNINQDLLDVQKITDSMEHMGLHENPKDYGVKRVSTKDIKHKDKLPFLKTQQWGNKGGLTYTDGYCIGLLYSSPTAFIKNDKYDAYVWCLPKAVEFAQSILTTWLNKIDHSVIRAFEQKQNEDMSFNVFIAHSKALSDYMRQFGLPTPESVKNNTFGLPKCIWDSSDEFRQGFVDSMYTINGGIHMENGLTFIVNRSEQTIRDMWDMFGFYGIASTIKLNANNQNHNFVILDADRFSLVFRCSDVNKQKELDRVPHKKQERIGDIEIAKCELTELKEDVWDITVYDNNHMFMLSHCFTGNCGEQSLANMETCCLQELFLPNIDSEEELKKCAKMMYKVAKHSLSLPCHQVETESIVHENMRMGIGVTGVLQAREKMDWLDNTYKELREFDKQYSAEHGFPTSIKLTTVKPSGCVHPKTRINTNHGIMTMEELFVYCGVDIKNNTQKWHVPNKKIFIKDRKNNIQQVNRLYDNGVKELLTFEVNGEDVICTPDHAFLVLRNGKQRWVSASNLDIGDEIVSYPTS